jgi:hypothetical protein
LSGTFYTGFRVSGSPRYDLAACVWTPEQGPFATAHEQTDPQAVVALLKAYCQALTHLWADEAA